MTITITDTDYQETVNASEVRPLTAHTCRFAGETYITLEDLETTPLPRYIHLIDPRDVDC